MYIFVLYNPRNRGLANQASLITATIRGMILHPSGRLELFGGHIRRLLDRECLKIVYPYTQWLMIRFPY